MLCTEYKLFFSSQAKESVLYWSNQFQQRCSIQLFQQRNNFDINRVERKQNVQEKAFVLRTGGSIQLTCSDPGRTTSIT